MESVVNKNSVSYYQNKKVFITGHTGFKGSWLMVWLNLLGANLKGYSLAPDNEQGLFNALAGQIKFQHIIGDIRDKETLKKEILDFLSSLFNSSLEGHNSSMQ